MEVTFPTDWNSVTLDSCAAFITKGSTPTTYGFPWQDTGILFLRSECVSSWGLDLSQSMFISDEAHKMLDRSKVSAGDILMTITGNVGRVVRLGSDISEANINQHISRIRISDGNVNSNFVYHFLSQAAVRDYFEKITTGQAYPQISLKQVRDFKVPAPCPIEQKTISAILNDADALIEGLEKLIVKKRLIKQGAMQDLLTGERRLPGFFEEWTNKKLREISEIDPENLGHNTNLDFSFNYIALDDVNYGVLRNYSEQIFSEAPSRARRSLSFNDVLVSTVRPNLMSHFLFQINDNNWVCSTGFSVVRCRPNVAHPKYIFFYLFGCALKRQINALITGSNYPAINSSDVGALEIFMPNYPEQAAIASMLSDMDAEITGLEAKLEKTRKIKQGMMQDLLTGRVRLI